MTPASPLTGDAAAEEGTAADAHRRVAVSSEAKFDGIDWAEAQVPLSQLLDVNIRFPKRPVFVPDLDVFEMPDGLGFQFRGLEAPVILRGRITGTVVRHLRERLDGTTTLEELLREVPEGVSPSAFVRALLVLHGKGLLVSAPSLQPHDEARAGDDVVLGRQLLYWGRHLGITRSAASAREVQQRLATARVVVVGTGLFGAATVDLLARSGFGNLHVIAWNDDGVLERAIAPANPGQFQRLASTAIDPALLVLGACSDGADLLVTATCDAPTLLFRAINDLSLRTGLPWLCGNADGSAVDIGPLMQPYETACFTCLELRRDSARELAFEHAFYDERLSEERDAQERVLLGEAVWPATLAASLLVGEACRFVTGLAAATLANAVLRVLPVTGTMEVNRFSRVPRCPACFRGAVPPETLPL